MSAEGDDKIKAKQAKMKADCHMPFVRRQDELLIVELRQKVKVCLCQCVGTALVSKKQIDKNQSACS